MIVDFIRNSLRLFYIILVYYQYNKNLYKFQTINWFSIEKSIILSSQVVPKCMWVNFCIRRHSGFRLTHSGTLTHDLKQILICKQYISTKEQFYNLSKSAIFWGVMSKILTPLVAENFPLKNFSYIRNVLNRVLMFQNLSVGNQNPPCQKLCISMIIPVCWKYYPFSSRDNNTRFFSTGVKELSK